MNLVRLARKRPFCLSITLVSALAAFIGFLEDSFLHKISLSANESKSGLPIATNSSNLTLQPSPGELRPRITTITKITNDLVYRDLYPPTNSSIAVCLFMMDDRIKLIEWLAYQYTVLPMRELIVGIDPKSRHLPEVETILGRWKPYINIKIVTIDEYGYKDPNTGWGNLHLRAWFNDTESTLYKNRVHHRNERGFYVWCMRDHRARGATWTWLGDTDEYVLPNYMTPEEKTMALIPDHNISDNAQRETNLQHRQSLIDKRRTLPPLSEHIPIVDIIGNHRQFSKKPHCIRFADIKFSAYESKRYGKNDTGYLLTTHRHVRHGPREKGFTKVFINLRGVTTRRIPDLSFTTVHLPHRKLCNLEILDYRLNLLRFNHYRTGSLESLLERGTSDFRYSDVETFFRSRNMEPIGVNTDILPWWDWFVELLGEKEARRLVLEPLQEAYANLDTSNFTRLEEKLFMYLKDNSTKDS
jgi:hypothetical protein